MNPWDERYIRKGTLRPKKTEEQFDNELEQSLVALAGGLTFMLAVLGFVWWMS